MKRIIVLALACAIAPLAAAQLYKYVDKDGKTVYSDQPPANVDSQQLHVSTGTSSGSKSYVARDKELDKTREADKERDKKKEVTAENARLAEERCNIAQSNLRTYSDGGRLFKYNAQGEREVMNDDEISTERDKAQKQVDEACKKS
jgi:hypothetical protein